MAIIYTYPVKTNPVGDDLILISDSADTNNTKQVKVSTLPSSGGGSVSSVGFSLNSLAAFTVTGDNPVTGSGTITLGTTGGSSGQYLDYQGNWSTPANTTYDVMGSSNSYAAGLVLAGSATHSNNFLRKDGTWASPPVIPSAPLNSVQFNSASTLSGNDELTYDGVGGLTVGAAGGSKGIVILQGEDGNDSGILKIGHLNNTKYLSLGLGNDTMAASYSIDFPVATPGGNNKILESNSLGVLSWIDTPSASGGSAGWDVMNLAHGSILSGNANEAYYYQVVSPSTFTPAKIKVKASVAGGSSNFKIAIYRGSLTNLNATALLGQGQISPTASGIYEVTLTEASTNSLNLTAGDNIILGFFHTQGDKLLSNGATPISDTGLAVVVAGLIENFPSTLGSISGSATNLRPCCTIY